MNETQDTANRTVSEPITTDAIARFELDELEASVDAAVLTIEVDIPQSVVAEVERQLEDANDGVHARDLLLERVNIDARFTSDGEPVDIAD